MDYPFSDEQRTLQSLAQRIATEHLRPRADQTDRDARFPQESFQELGNAGLMGLNIPRRYGGLEADMLSIVLVLEALAKECPSTAMCFKMYLEAVNPLSQVATADQAERFLRPIARGELLMSVAANEPTGGRPLQSLARPVEGGFLVENAQKAFVTSSHHSQLFLF